MWEEKVLKKMKLVTFILSFNFEFYVSLVMEAFIIQILKFCFKAASLGMSVLKQVYSLGFMLDM